MEFFISVQESGVSGRRNKYTLESDLDGSATLGDLLLFTKGALIKIAQDTLKDEQSKGFDPDPSLIVDGQFGKTLQDVNPLGKIQYVARMSLKDIILDTYAQIIARTKIVTGEYGRNNVVLFNGVQVANTKQTLAAWLQNKQDFEAKDKIRFINTMPYARKLESLGISKGEGGPRRKQKTRSKKRKGQVVPNSTVSVPNGTYALAFKAVARKYKNNSFIAYRLVPGSEVSITGSDVSEKTGKNFRRTFAKGKSAGRPYLYPSILISAVLAGITDGN